ncbi:MAG TPA: dTDP-4-dehydrorhamnose reductase [Bacteroidales bacterium]|nr:dTDP-4-dehydrorhamnose reductase [Bacteroidales bacterium]HRW95701.1 dTDP-4-dehydrorhamnose reductase [Bacteroidales bacterium]
MKVVLTGASGGVGSIVRKMAVDKADITLAAFSREQLDITDPHALMSCFMHEKPDYVINTAAFTHVDKAEESPGAAYLLNANCLEGMIKACEKNRTVLIHLSTDYVFDGQKTTPYTEEDLTAPVNVYGASKRAGELKALAYARGIVVRTSWVYSRYSRNFLAAVPGLLRNQSGPLYVDALQKNSPTYAPDLVNALFSLMRNRVESGLFHYTNSGGGCSRYVFALKVRDMIRKMDSAFVPVPVLPVVTGYTEGAPRPVYTVMSSQKISHLPGVNVPHWQEGIENII